MNNNSTKNSKRQVNTITIHHELALYFLRTKSDLQQKSFVVWCYLRSTGNAHFYRDELVDHLAERFNRQKRTIRKWLNGMDQAGLSRTTQHGNIVIFGRDKVVASLLQKQFGGKSVLVEADHLLQSGKTGGDIRSILEATLFCKRERGTWISRAKITKLTGYDARTQRRWDKKTEVKKTKVFCLDLVQNTQLPNIYHRPEMMFTRTSNKVDKTRKCSNKHLSPAGSYRPVASERLIETRLLFGDSENAQIASKRRQRKELNPLTFSPAIPKIIHPKAKRHMFVNAHFGEA